MLFPNPERRWHSERPAPVLDRSEITERIGFAPKNIRPLFGGLANDTFQIDESQVLRIYRRDPSALRLEHLLLNRTWQHLRVPEVRGKGEDFLLLEYVPHRPMENSAFQGRAVGAALAEIHTTTFEACGTFGDSLELANPWADFPDAIENYVRDNMGTAATTPRRDLIERVANFVCVNKGLLHNECGCPVLLHGDFKASNLHWTSSDQLLVLDWEFTYAGPALMDIGQLARWGLPQPFRAAFLDAYVDAGGSMPDRWEILTGWFDLVNLVGLMTKTNVESQKSADCRRRIEDILDTSEP